MTWIRRHLRILPALFAGLTVSSPFQKASAIVGNQSAGNGVIGQAHINYAAQLNLGQTVGFIHYGNGTATGTLVPSSEAGVIKFLTAAHNVDSNNDGILDAGAGNITIYFGNTPGEAGAGATYTIVATAAQIAINPLWATSGGSATHDMAVVSFTTAQITTGTPGGSLQTSAVSNTTALGREVIVAGHGLHADGTINLGGENPENGTNPPGNESSQVNGILKAGTNVADFFGVPGDIKPATISPNSGQVILLDFDRYIAGEGEGGAGGVGAPGTSTFGDANGVKPLEAGTAKGDSGSALYADTNGDGKLEVVGVLNGGDNPFGGASMFGDISQYAPVLTVSNLAFLALQNVFVGTSFGGVSAGEFGGPGFAVVDMKAIRNFQTGVAAAQQTAAFSEKTVQTHLGDIKNHLSRFQRATSRLENFGGDRVTMADMAGFGSRRWEFWVAGEGTSVDTELSGAASGVDSRFASATVGLDFLITSDLIAGVSWSHLFGRGSSSISDLELENDGNAIGLSLAGNWGGLNSTFLYSYAASKTEMERNVAGNKASSATDVSAHILDWVVSYNFRQGHWVHGPTAGVQYINGRSDAYTEGGPAGIGLLSVADQDFSSLRFELGYNISYHQAISAGKLVPYLNAAWIYENRKTDDTTAAFQGSPFFGIGGGPVGSFPAATVQGGDASNGFTHLKGGVELLTNGGFSVNLQAWVNLFRSDTAEFGGGIQLGVAF